MKLIALVGLLLPTLFSGELISIRKQYTQAATSESVATAFHAELEGIETKDADPTLVAYKAASMVLLAKYESGLIRKTKLFNRGTDLLDSTIAKSPANYEARLLRLSIQENVPWITGYTSEIDEDKAFLIKNYAKQEQGLKDFTKKYVMQSEEFSKKEKAIFD